MSDKPKLVDPSIMPVTKLGSYELNDLPDDYDSRRHGPVPLFVKYEGFVDKLLDAFDQGASQEVAASYAGTTRNTFAHWLRKGRAARRKVEEKGGPEAADLDYWDPYYMALVEIVEAKDAERQLALLKSINKAGNQKVEGQWTAHAWLLERLWPENYSTKHEMRHVGHDGGAIKSEVSFSLKMGDNADRIKTSEEEIEEGDFEILEQQVLASGDE